MQQRQTPTKEQLEYWYIQLNKSRKEIAEMIGYSEAWVHKRLGIYGIKKESAKRLENVRKTLRGKYGVDYPFQNPQVCRTAIENMKQTYTTKEYPNRLTEEEVKQRQRESSLRYCGVKRKERRQKDEMEAESRGISYEDLIEERKRNSALKSRKTLMERYGVPSAVTLNLPKRTQVLFSDKSRLEKYLKETRFGCTKEIAKDLGCAVSTLYPRLQKWGLTDLLPKKETSGEFLVRTFLEEEEGQWVRTRKVIAPYELDFYCQDRKVAIEYNGNFYHNSQHRGVDYHLNKYLKCKELGIDLLHIYEYEEVENIALQIHNFLSFEGQHQIVTDLKSLPKGTIIEQEIGKHRERWFICSGYEVVEMLPPMVTVVHAGKSYSSEIWNCGYYVWEKKYGS